MKVSKLKFKGYKILVVAIAVIFAISIVLSVKDIIVLRSENRQLKEENQELIDERDNLKLELKNVNTPEFIEEQARRQLKLVNPDEILFILPEEDCEKADE